MQNPAAAAKLEKPLPSDISIHQPRDPNTLSNYNAWRCQHVKAELAIDFDAKTVSGKVALDMKKLHDGKQKIVLDTSYLDVQGVRINGSKVQFEVASSRTGPYGSPLTIEIPSDSTGDVTVEITTSTTKDCTALQWLTAAQTPNKKHPYMFSQCQAIHARSLFPCQDTPDVKATYDFVITSPLPVLASGLVKGEADAASPAGQKTYTFNQPIPIPSYLFAIASGDIASAEIGPRSCAYCGPDEVSAVKWEFEQDMEHFIEVAEKLVFPYPWGPYNVLVLPNSFPYGGMENPIVSYLTPTLISGDRQNVDVVAHELSHSWSGNLVSNCSWEHFWLNEGWTTYLERRIAAALHGEAHRDFSAIIGWKALSDSIANFGEDHEFTKMIPDLKGKDPDDAFSSIPYEKGFVFLYYLEKLVGKDKWDKFIPHYFRKFERKSLDSYDFKATLLDFFASDSEASKKLNDLDWDKWFYSPGFPVEKPNYDTSLADKCYALANSWETLNTGSSSSWEPKKSDLDGWMANQSVVFLEKVQTFDKPLSSELVEKMGSTYAFATSQNVELVSRYFVIGLKAKAESVYKPTAELLGRVGRMKFVRPLYRGLKTCDEKLAKETFQKNKDFYHPICRAMVEKDLYGHN
ncbi:leukotriene A-4 hydrolase [Myriangium duriaei CBS 260.36]|uniref:Leukotriene A(4) hydrolase n=1 Tax=Myriangium duriaei CBS 260.36 TaxID=1168546 RepID=A0A9P4IYP5_9PEZI|nr:leukotriene A-4 hydrolase [Myriangium duriaei CBS 260.36]